LFVLSGFDRLRCCGDSRLLNHAGGVDSYLYQPSGTTRPTGLPGRRTRGSRFESSDRGRRDLLRALAKGEFLLHAFHNRDLRLALHGACRDAEQRREQAAGVPRLLAMVRAHGPIVEVQKIPLRPLERGGQTHGQRSARRPRRRRQPPGRSGRV